MAAPSKRMTPITSQGLTEGALLRRDSWRSRGSRSAGSVPGGSAGSMVKLTDAAPPRSRLRQDGLG